MIRSTHLAPLLVASLAVAGPVHAQTRAPRATHAADRLNLDFERLGLVAPDWPRGWLVTAPMFEVVTDSVVVRSGARSLRVRAIGGSIGTSAELRSLTPIPGVAGKRVRLRGYLRTDGVGRGRAGLWIRSNGSGASVLAADTVGTNVMARVSEWTPLELSVVADPAAASVTVGITVSSDGTAWFDGLTLEVDGRPAASLLAEWTPSSDEIRWVRDHAIPIATTDPAAPLGDLRPFGDFVGDARIVALGEGTHGTAEFFGLKQRLVRYLAERKGFTVFALESHMPETRRLNEYVLTGRGDVRAALAGLYFPYWNSREMVELVEWMRAYNASGRGRIEFWGFDMQVPDEAMDSVRAFVGETEPDFLPELDSAYDRVRAVLVTRRPGPRASASPVPWRDAAALVLAHLESRSADYRAQAPDSMRVAWAIQYARIVLQGAQSALGGTTVRDSNMATNVAWIDAHHPAGTRTIVSSLDRHVHRMEGWMGIHLHRRFADSLRVVGTAFGEGTYTSNGARGLTAYPADVPPAGSVESVLRATRRPIFALDLRGASRDAASRWLTRPHDFRIIGTMANDNAFAPQRVAGEYDMLFYVDRTRASTLLEGTLPRP